MTNKAGFTLIEVLIALAIISIALSAIIQSTSENIRHTLYLQNKTIATWVGLQVMNEIRAGLVKLPAAPDPLEGDTNMLSQTWFWKAHFTPTPNTHIQEIDVDVNKKNTDQPLSHLMSYLYVP